MALSSALIETLKDRATIPALLRKLFGEETHRQLAFCPFHKNTKTRAFYICHEDRGFICYGCGVRGDAIGFVRLASRQKGMEISYETALAVLANLVGIKLDESPDTLLAVCGYLATAESEPIAGIVLSKWARDKAEPVLRGLIQRGGSARGVGLVLDDRLEDILWPSANPTVGEVQKGVHDLLKVGMGYLRFLDQIDDFEPDFEPDA